MGSVTGYLEFTQNTDDDTTYAYAYLEGLEETPNGFHVHDFPINGFGDYDLSDTGCGGAYTGGHWDPLDTGLTCTVGGDWSACEPGDLSGAL